jgi:hypothetical protein
MQQSELAPAQGEMLCLVPDGSSGSHAVRWISSGSRVVRLTKGGSCANVDKLWAPPGHIIPIANLFHAFKPCDYLSHENRHTGAS